MKKSRFTLIELLCVVATICVLLSMLFPAYLKSRKAARKVLCASSEKQMSVAAMSFAISNKGGMPWGTPNTGYWPGSTEFGNGFLNLEGNEAMYQLGLAQPWLGIGVLRPWLGIVDVGGTMNQSIANKVLYCPSGRDITYDGPRGMKNFGSDPAISYISTNYIWNSNFGMVPGSTWGRQVKISDPGRTPLLADQCFNGDSTWPRPNHDDGYTVLRLDGSVNFIKMDANAFHMNIRWVDHVAMYERAWSMSTGAFR